MAIERELRNIERDAASLESVRQAAISQITDQNRRLENAVSEAARTMFATDKEFEKSLTQQGAEGKQVQFSRGGKTFDLAQVDPATVIRQRELTSAEQARLKNIEDSLDEIAFTSKGILGGLNRELYLAEQFKKLTEQSLAALAKDIQELQAKAAAGDAQAMQAATVATQEMNQLQQRLAPMTAAIEGLKTAKNDATRIMVTAQQGTQLLKQVQDRTDLEDILLAASAGFGITAGIAALAGGGAAAGILALPALIAFAASRLVLLFKRVTEAAA